MKTLVGLLLVVIGVSLFVIFTSSLNAAQSDGAPIGIMLFSDRELSLIVISLDLFFLAVALGGARLAGLRQATVGVILAVAGAVILLIGIWHHVEGPPLDKVGPPYDDRIPVSQELNIVVYILAGLSLGLGLLLGILVKPRRTN
jgi:hypothetical protein